MLSSPAPRRPVICCSVMRRPSSDSVPLMSVMACGTSRTRSVASRTATVPREAGADSGPLTETSTSARPSSEACSSSGDSTRSSSRPLPVASMVRWTRSARPERWKAPPAALRVTASALSCPPSIRIRTGETSTGRSCTWSVVAGTSRSPLRLAGDSTLPWRSSWPASVPVTRDGRSGYISSSNCCASTPCQRTCIRASPGENPKAAARASPRTAERGMAPVRTSDPPASCAAMPSVVTTSPASATCPDGIVNTGIPGRAKRTPARLRVPVGDGCRIVPVTLTCPCTRPARVHPAPGTSAARSRSRSAWRSRPRPGARPKRWRVAGSVMSAASGTRPARLAVPPGRVTRRPDVTASSPSTRTSPSAICTSGHPGR